MGTGILNWVFALPAFFTIDKFGRRPLLIFTFPFLAIFLLWTGMSFFIDQPPPGSTESHSTKRIAMITTGMYLCVNHPPPPDRPRKDHASSINVHQSDLNVSTLQAWVRSPLPTLQKHFPCTSAMSACHGPQPRHGVSTSSFPSPSQPCGRPLPPRALSGGMRVGASSSGSSSFCSCRRRKVRFFSFEPFHLDQKIKVIRWEFF